MVCFVVVVECVFVFVDVFLWCVVWGVVCVGVEL